MLILTSSHFLAEVVYTPEFFTTKLQPHSLMVSRKKKFSPMQL